MFATAKSNFHAEPSMPPKPAAVRPAAVREQPVAPLAADRIAAPTLSSSVPLDLYSQAVRDRAGIVARSENGAHMIVQGSDGVLRRAAPDHGARMPLSGTEVHMGRAIARDARRVYDPPQNTNSERKAGFVVQEGEKTLSYQVGNRFVKRTARRGDMEAYQLAPGKWMIPQPEYRACTHAAEAMLLTEGKSPAQMKTVLNGLDNHLGYSRRETTPVINSLESAYGRKPLVKTFGGSPAAIAKKIKSSVKRHGAGILMGAGHATVVDSGTKGTGLAVREPFHGGYHEIGSLPAFVKSQLGGGTAEKKLTLIFRPSDSPSGSGIFKNPFACFKNLPSTDSVMVNRPTSSPDRADLVSPFAY